eukprot:SAG31_NODE_4585_length_3116_cov_5.020882_2_plen_117_part_00
MAADDERQPFGTDSPIPPVAVGQGSRLPLLCCLAGTVGVTAVLVIAIVTVIFIIRGIGEAETATEVAGSLPWNGSEAGRTRELSVFLLLGWLHPIEHAIRLPVPNTLTVLSCRRSV